MSDPEAHAIRPGSTPLSNGPATNHDGVTVHKITEDGAEETYVDPVTVVNHTKPVAEKDDAASE